MEQASFCLFEAPLDPCGIAWQEAATPGKVACRTKARDMAFDKLKTPSVTEGAQG